MFLYILDNALSMHYSNYLQLDFRVWSRKIQLQTIIIEQQEDPIQHVYSVSDLLHGDLNKAQ